MLSNVSFQVTSLSIYNEEIDGQLVFIDRKLVALLTHLVGKKYGESEDRWFLEVGYGPCFEKHPEPFRTLNEALGWIEQQWAQ